MIEFKAYQSKPITREAYRIAAEDTVVFDAEASRGFLVQAGTGAELDFAAFQEIEAGDYVVHLSAEDIYHCSAEVFHERNIVD